MKNILRDGLILMSGLLIAATASAQYKSIGPDGRVTYSDLPPPPNARIIEQKKKPGGGGVANAPLPFELQQAADKFPVTLYTGDKCTPCDDARAYLRSRGVPFTEKTVTSDEDIAAFRQQSPDGTAPVLTVGSRKFVGFAQSSVAGLLDSAGYPATSTLPRDYQNVAATPLSPTTRAPAQKVAQTPPATRRGTAATGDATPPPAPPPVQSGFRF